MQMYMQLSYMNGVRKVRTYLCWTPGERTSKYMSTRCFGHSKLQIDGKQYCLTHLEFDINVAPFIMKAIVSTVMSQAEAIDLHGIILH